MTQYYDESVVVGLKPIGGSGQSSMSGRHSHYAGNAAPFRLIGVYDRLIFKVAVDVTSFEDFQEFEGQYS